MPDDASLSTGLPCDIIELPEDFQPHTQIVELFRSGLFLRFSHLIWNTSIKKAKFIISLFPLFSTWLVGWCSSKQKLFMILFVPSLMSFHLRSLCLSPFLSFIHSRRFIPKKCRKIDVIMKHRHCFQCFQTLFIFVEYTKVQRVHMLTEREREANNENN